MARSVQALRLAGHVPGRFPTFAGARRLRKVVVQVRTKATKGMKAMKAKKAKKTKNGIPKKFIKKVMKAMKACV